MTASAHRTAEWLSGLSAACDRLVHPSVTGEAERLRHRKIIALLLAGPFALAAALAQTAAPAVGVAVALALVCGLLACALSTLVLLSATGDERAAAPALLAIAGGGIALVIAFSGSLASPLALLAIAPLAEAAWLRAGRRGLAAAAAAAALAIAAQAVLPGLIGTAGAAASGWHWIVPAAYAASLMTRFGRPAALPAAAADDAAARALDDAVALAFAPSGEVVDASANARDIVGLPAELLLQQGLFERIHVADRVAFLSAIGDVRAGAERGVCAIRIRLPQAGGEGGRDGFRLFELRIGRAESGGFLPGLLRDVEELARLRAELALARDRRDDGEAAKARLLATVSHELRTPLNAIIGFSDMLLHGIGGTIEDPRQREYVGLIRDSGSHLLAIVNAILDVSKIEAGCYDLAPEPFRFAEALEMCRNMMLPQAAEKQVAVETALAPDTGTILADRRAVRQMLINLLSNAVKFTPAGGIVRVAAWRADGRLHFSVSDTGIGMAEADLERVGEPFIQVQNDYTRRFDGTGLGLSLVKGLVKLHKGTMTIESAPGAGTTVSISLPADGAARAAGAEVVPLDARKRDEKDATIRKIA